MDRVWDLLVSNNWHLTACVTKYFDALDSGVVDDILDGASAGVLRLVGPPWVGQAVTKC